MSTAKEQHIDLSRCSCINRHDASHNNLEIDPTGLELRSLDCRQLSRAGGRSLFSPAAGRRLEIDIDVGSAPGDELGRVQRSGRRAPRRGPRKSLDLVEAGYVKAAVVKLVKLGKMDTSQGSTRQGYSCPGAVSYSGEEVGEFEADIVGSWRPPHHNTEEHRVAGYTASLNYLGRSITVNVSLMENGGEFIDGSTPVMARKVLRQAIAEILGHIDVASRGLKSPCHADIVPRAS